jgi:hypothetical protein
MDKNSTLNDLSDFYKNDKKLSKLLVDMEEMTSYFELVSNSVVSNILAYSKALSVRDSKFLGKIELILN